MLQIEFMDGDLSYVDHIRLDGMLDSYRFKSIFDTLVHALLLNEEDFFILHQVRENLSNDDDCVSDFVRIVFRSFSYDEGKVRDIVAALLFGLKVTW